MNLFSNYLTMHAMRPRNIVRPRMRSRSRYGACCARAMSGLALLVTVTACGGAESAGGPKLPTLTPVSANVATYGLAVATVRGLRLTEPTVPGTIGGVPVIAGRVNDTTLAFLVPPIPAGVQPLAFSVGTATLTTTLQVTVTAPVANPTAYVMALDSMLAATLPPARRTVARGSTGLVPFNPAGHSADLQRASSALDSARTIYATLAAVDQLEAATVLRATYGESGGRSAAAVRLPLGSESLTSLRVNSRPDYCGDPDLPLTEEESQACDEAASEALLEFENDTEVCAADAQEAAQRGVRATIRTFLWQIVNGCHYANLTAWSAETWDTLEFPTVPEFDPFAGVADELRATATLVTGTTTAIGPMAANPVLFAPGQSTIFSPTIRFRPMIASDVGKVPAASAKSQLLRGLATSWRALNARFGGGATQPPATLEQVTTARSRQLRYAASRLRLGIITPATVRGTATIVNGSWQLQFDSDNRTQAVPFTFTTIYDGGKYGADTLVVPALLTDSIGIYTGALVGNWTITNIARGNTTPLVLRADGTGTETMPSSMCPTDPARCDVTVMWSVSRRDDGRYIFQAGHWEGGSGVAELALPLPATLAMIAGSSRTYTRR